MKKGILLVAIFLSLIIISNVLAYQSTITVKTGVPNQEIIFRAADPDSGKIFENGEFRQKSDGKGIVIFNYSLEPIRIKASFMAWSGDSYIAFMNERETVFIPNIILDEFVDIDLNTQSTPVPVIYHSNQTKEVKEVVEETIITENNSETNNSGELEVKVSLVNETGVKSEVSEAKSSSFLTGAVIGRGKAIFTSGLTYYIFIGFLVLIGVFVLVRRTMHGRNSPQQQFRVTKLSDMKTNEMINERVNGMNNSRIEESDESLADAERKIEEARRELDEIKNRKNRVRELQDKLQRDKEELRRLNGEDDYLGLGRP